MRCDVSATMKIQMMILMWFESF